MMGCWDFYCAFCGGPLQSVSQYIRPKQQADRFPCSNQLGAVTVGVDSQQEEDREVQQDRNEENDSLISEQEDSPVDDDEEFLYDAAVISPADVKWTKTLHVLGFGTTKAFVSGPCRHGEYDGTVEVTSGDDLTFSNPREMYCYVDWGGDNPLFPFHWCCFEILCKVLTGTTDTNGIDKDLLYRICLDLDGEERHRLPNIDYGNPGPLASQYWETEAGKEFVVINPMKTPRALAELITSTVTSIACNQPQSFVDLTSSVQYDPFTNLPVDLVEDIAFLLSPTDLIQLLNGSWAVFSALNNNSGFWTRCIRSGMPWFFEAHDFLDQSDQLDGKTLKMMYLWLDQMTSPRLYMSGPFMGIANRRRVWYVCEQLADKYIPKLCLNAERLSAAEEMIRSQSVCQNLLSVCTHRSTNWEVVSTFWVKSWETIFMEETIFETFWDSSGLLVGLGTSSAGGRRLLGIDETHDQVSRQGEIIPRQDWITGIIIHMSLSDIRSLHEDQDIGIKGITVSYYPFPKGVNLSWQLIYCLFRSY
ncbi:hypothetical protein BGZ63DRAFT_254009 [Mariannaea sp. PMI_226]|nr:hypothetical protein BGZ63DRAFT_254009 [Mariannaea sp. PMI_226]